MKTKRTVNLVLCSYSNMLKQADNERLMERSDPSLLHTTARIVEKKRTKQPTCKRNSACVLHVMLTCIAWIRMHTCAHNKPAVIDSEGHRSNGIPFHTSCDALPDLVGHALLKLNCIFDLGILLE